MLSSQKISPKTSKVFKFKQQKLSILLVCRRGVACSMLIWSLVIVDANAADAPASNDFDFEEVITRAKQLGAAPFRAPESRVPDFLLQKNDKDIQAYDRYRDIRFKKEHTLWGNTELPFQVQMFHPGLYYHRTVELYVVDSGVAEKIPFSTDLFDYGENVIKDKIPSDLGFAGFRIHAPIKSNTYYDEVAVFLGGSYFRAVGRDHQWGLSARGLAIDTAQPSGEEFPYFTEFWLVKPKPGDTSMVVYALLESPSATGAYRFVITPGEDTSTEVEAHVIARKAVDKLGLACLTSMYFYGENTLNKPLDFRPEVHDSDGLMIHTNTGEWIWRPIQNDRHLLINVFSLLSPRGFGLLQRDRNFDHYQDLEARYDNRPSAWIVPKGEWGEGRVELIQIPTPDEYRDNIVAIWVPKIPLKPGEMYSLSYRLDWHTTHPDRRWGGYVSATRVMPTDTANVQKVIVDFNGRELEALTSDSPLEAIIDVSENGKIIEHQLYKNHATQGWRLVLKARLDNDKPMELRVSLKRGNDYLTETWSYSIVP